MSSQRPEDRTGVPDPDVADTPDSTHRSRAALLLVIAAGGALGAVARYAAGQAWPTGDASFPLTTLLVNVVGCALMGMLMVLVTEPRPAPALVRPFLGTGVLGGFTTFSTYAVDADRLLRLGDAGLALLSLVLTLVLAVAAVWAGAAATRALVRRSS